MKAGQLERVIENSLNEVFVFDADTLKFRFVNLGARQNLNYTMDELQQLTPVDIKPEFDQETFMSMIEPLNTFKVDKLTFETIHQRKDGSLYNVEVHLQYFDEGDDKFYCAIILDITEKIRTNRALIKALDDANTATKVKSNFLALMSHELRTPLNAIIGFSELISQRIKKHESAVNDHKIPSYNNHIYDSGQALLTMIDKLLDYTNMIRGDAPLNNEIFVPNRELKELFNSYLPIMDVERIKLEIEHLPDDIIVNGDLRKIKQVCRNIMDNAIRHADQKPIVISSDISSFNENQYKLTVSIKDNGSGISPDMIPQLFDNFALHDDAMSKTHAGIGLGLSMSRNITRAMGGDITVNSKLGHGSEFVATFILDNISHDHAVVKDQKSLSANANLSALNLNILVVDDVSANLRVISEILNDFDCTVTTANSGYEAIEAARSKPFDVIFMDIHMPKMNGVETATSILKNLDNGTKPYFYAWTADVSGDDLLTQSDVPWQGIIHKPTRYKELWQILSTHTKSLAS